MTKTKLEKVLEYVVNGENELASEMLHEHFIETARNIYADLAEDDNNFEEDLDLDEDFHDEDESDDFISDISDEIETEEYFGEDEDEDDEDDSMDDLEGEMDMDNDLEMSDGDFDDSDDDFGDDDFGDDSSPVDSALTNVEDAMDELRAAFADIMGDNADDGMDDEVADEFDDMDDFDNGDDLDDESLEDDDLGESATLSKHAVTMKGDEDGKASPVRQNQPNISDRGKAVNFAGGSDENGGKGDSAKKMNVTGPQEQKGRMDKKVAAPSNKSETAKSHLGSKR